MKLKNLFVKTLILTSFFFITACSSDDSDGGEIAIEYDKNANISGINIEATKIVADIEAVSTKNLSIGIRKKGESEFKEYSASQLINGLSPAQVYEITILVRDQNTSLFPIKEFVTKPFDYLSSLNSEISFKYINSASNFKHEATIGYYEEGSINFNANEDYKLFLIDTSDTSNKIPLPFERKDGKINFVIPDNLIPQDTYTLYKSFFLGYQVGSSEIGYIEQFQNERDPLIFVIQNPNPHINEVSKIDTFSCESTTTYEIVVIGHFMNDLLSNKPYYYQSSTLLMTDVETGKEIILSEDSGANCISHDRFTNSGSVTLSDTGLTSIHTAIQLKIKYPKTDAGQVVFTTGKTYKIKLTFANGASDFYETNEVEFTLP